MQEGGLFELASLKRKQKYTKSPPPHLHRNTLLPTWPEGLKNNFFKRLHDIQHTIEQVALNQTSLVLKIQIQNTQTLQLFTRLIKQKVYTKVIKNAKQKAWVQRPSGLIKMGEEAQAL